MDQITLGLAGLNARNGAAEGARLTAYDADGDVLDTWVFKSSGKVKVDFDGPVQFATLEATDWLGGGHALASEPDFALVSLSLDYL